MGTIEFSRVIAESSAPIHKVTSPNPEDVEIEHGTPGGRVDLNTFEDYELIAKQGLDPAIMEAKDRLTTAMQRATIADILVTGQPMGGVEAFSAYQLQVQVAIASLGGIKELGERFYEQCYEKMLLISYYTGQDISGYGDVKKYTIDSGHIDPSKIYLSVELKPDVPVDRVARVTAAVQMAAQLKYPTEKILEFLGETDPQGAMRMWEIEQMDNAYLQGLMRKLESEGSGELDQMAQMLEQLMQQQEQMAQMAQQQQGPGRTPENFGEGIPGVEGQGFDPAQGGLPPAQASPSATREQLGPEAAGAPEI